MPVVSSLPHFLAKPLPYTKLGMVSIFRHQAVKWAVKGQF